MKCFRITDPKWSSPPHLLNGQGAKRTGQRWNPPGIAALYLGESLDVAAAEIGYYKIQLYIEVFSKDFNIRGELQKRLHKTRVSLATLEVSDKLNLADLSEEKPLAENVKGTPFAKYRVDDTRKSPFLMFPEKWSQELGRLLHSRDVHGFVVRSARSNAGNCVVLFPEKLGTDDIQVQSVEQIELSASTKSGARFRKGQNPVSGKVLLHRSGTSQLLDTLHFPLDPPT